MCVGGAGRGGGGGTSPRFIFTTSHNLLSELEPVTLLPLASVYF